MRGDAAAYYGQLRQSREMFRRAIEVSERRGGKEWSAWNAAEYALLSAAFGYCQQTKKETADALAFAREKEAMWRSALALALCGEDGRAQSIADEMARHYPKRTVVNLIWLPMIRAAIEINRGYTAQAIQLLQVTSRFDMSTSGQGWPAYVRALAYLRGRAAAEAIAEFQKIIDHRGSVDASALYPLAHLGLARAAALAGDAAKSRKAYEDFFALWKDADGDIPILQQAKQEYEKLR